MTKHKPEDLILIRKQIQNMEYIPTIKLLVSAIRKEVPRVIKGCKEYTGLVGAEFNLDILEDNSIWRRWYILTDEEHHGPVGPAFADKGWPVSKRKFNALCELLLETLQLKGNSKYLYMNITTHKKRGI